MIIEGNTIKYFVIGVSINSKTYIYNQNIITNNKVGIVITPSTTEIIIKHNDIYDNEDFDIKNSLTEEINAI